MAVNLYNIKRWYKMLTGKSLYHVPQGVGKVFVPGELRGYFNDMTQKVIMGDSNLGDDGIPFFLHSDGTRIQMPTMIFQYGLGAFDLWLLEGDNKFLEKAIKCAEWGVEHQLTNGAWNNFYYFYPDYPYSAMPQGEGASLLARVYNTTNDERYLLAAEKAINFMLLSVEDGGTCKYTNGFPCFLEYTHIPTVLNGWVFAVFGLYDFSIINHEERYKEMFQKAVSELTSQLDKFVGAFWSMYDLDGKIASPFYHNLHVAQMRALYLTTEKQQFLGVCNRWEKEQHSLVCRSAAFIRKAFQKIIE